jgi:hypothetical protein
MEMSLRMETLMEDISFLVIVILLITASDVILFPFYIQEVLAQVLEEAGYTKDSFLVLSDFMKVPKQLIFSMTCCTGLLRFHLGKHFMILTIYFNDMKAFARMVT